MNLLRDSVHAVTAFAPATCANVAVGFDILGFAIDGVGDCVTLTRREDKQIVIDAIDSPATLPLDVDKNTASGVVKKFCQELKIDTGFSIRISKGIPLSSGMGGSAASAVAALIACNAFLSVPLSASELVPYALFGEEIASGQQHADNIVPCIFGGFTLVSSVQPLEVVQLPLMEFCCILVHPHLLVPTKEARKILKEQLPLKDCIKQSAHLAAFIAALYKNDIRLLKKNLTDLLIEPQRAHFVPGFYKIKDAALKAGALGMSFSGSGPSLFAFAKNEVEAVRICAAMQEQLKAENIDSDSWISSISQYGARVQEIV